MLSVLRLRQQSQNVWGVVCMRTYIRTYGCEDICHGLTSKLLNTCRCAYLLGGVDHYVTVSSELIAACILHPHPSLPPFTHTLHSHPSPTPFTPTLHPPLTHTLHSHPSPTLHPQPPLPPFTPTLHSHPSLPPFTHNILHPHPSPPPSIIHLSCHFSMSHVHIFSLDMHLTLTSCSCATPGRR